MSEHRRYGESAGYGHSSYEEALRRSDERLGKVQRGARQLDQMQDEAYEDEPRPARYRQRSTVPLDASGGGQAGQTGQPPARPARPARPPHQTANRYSRPAHQNGEYRAQQLQQHARTSQNYRARPATFSTTAPAPTVSQRGMLVRVIVAAILVVAVVISFTRIGAAQGALGQAQSAVEAQAAQVEELNNSNAEMQTQLDSMKETIDKYNKLANSGS